MKTNNELRAETFIQTRDELAQQSLTLMELLVDKLCTNANLENISADDLTRIKQMKMKFAEISSLLEG
jgi:hypothetical protein